MRIWTIQPGDVLAALKARGVLHVDRHAAKYRGFTPVAYRWMKRQMGRRLGTLETHLPWWGYCQKPDLRNFRHIYPNSGEVRLELNIPDSELLAFPCWAWNRVFCLDFLATNQYEHKQWRATLTLAKFDYEAWPPPQPFKSMIVSSWNRLFDENLPLEDWDRSSIWKGRSWRECVFSTLSLDRVIRVDPLCTGREKR
jgi:Domain of unknown function (DUF3841)